MSLGRFRRRRFFTLFLIPIVILIGLGFKYYRGPGEVWVNHYGPASVAYEVLWMLFGFLIFPRRKSIIPIAIVVLVSTCAIEFLQLYHPPWLESLRQTFAGKFILGTTFSWWDFIAYPIGCLTGVHVLRYVSKISDPL